MQLAEVEQWFGDRGLPFAWRQERPGQAAILRPPPGRQIPIGNVRVGILVPDVHLGWGNDVFRFNDPNRERRLERFLELLAELRDELGTSAFTAVQLGDYFDFWRAPGFTAAQARAMILAQYPTLIQLGVSLPFRHCIGNHDAQFVSAAGRPLGLDAEIVRTIGTSAVVCFHGHDNRTLQALNVDALFETIGLNLLNLVNSTPLLGAVTSWLQRVGDGTFQESWVHDSASLPWDAAQVQGPAGWDAPWVSRSSAVEYGAALRGIELCLRQRVQVAFVGHSHRPGISWCPVAARRVPLIDVGSWTYGRAEFAVVCGDGVGLARLV
jgi:hypothetical protein